MSSCTCENWTLEDLASALQCMHKDKKRIAVPMFQRGKRWNKKQQEVFIDSLIKGYPVGTMLFYETFEDGCQTYILVDGLQRGNSIKKYMNNPTEFFYNSSIPDDFCSRIMELVSDEPSDENYIKVRTILTDFIKESKGFKNLQYYEPAHTIAETFSADFSSIGELIKVIGSFFKDKQDLFEKLAMTVIPVIVYHGQEENLPEIFDRINSQGHPLDQYEVYAAAWPVSKRFHINNKDIVEAAIKKYDAFIEDGYLIHGYDREKMRTSKQVNAFEYLFGLSKYITKRYDLLAFNTSIADDTVNPLGFELVNACLNDKDKIKTLYKNIYGIPNIDDFEKALYNAIDFVVNSVSAITRFKGNSRSGRGKLFHSKYQILSMISTTFKEMYSEGDYSHVAEDWNQKKTDLSKNLRLYYVYDIITNYWSEGGTSKIHSAAKPNRYLNNISPRAWGIALDSFFEKSMLRTEIKQISNPKSEEYVLLNCIYLNTFTAMDQLSIGKFDVEHIAPKEQMKRLIAKCSGKGLPISCVANLCYLPDHVNRSKHDSNFYQDTKYLKHIGLDTVEQKYSFTDRSDLEWMDIPYDTPEDFEVLCQFYNDFCTTRFETLKRLFCESMGIDYNAMNLPREELLPTATKSLEKPHNNNLSSRETTNNYTNECILRVENYIGEKLQKRSRSAYSSLSGKRGYVFSSSKAYMQGKREKYWFGYRKNPFDDIADCEEQYIVYGCKNANEVLVFPLEKIESLTDKMNFSLSDNGEISHWHIVFFRDENGHMTQLLSHPELSEIDIDKYKI